MTDGDSTWIGTAASARSIQDFLDGYFGPGFVTQTVRPDEQAVIDAIYSRLKASLAQPRPPTYILGLAIDFAVLAQQLSVFDETAKGFRPQLTEESLFKRYKLVDQRGGRAANTLTLRYQDNERGIRPVEENVAKFFHALDRTSYPSAYVYNTGQWRKFTDLLVQCFQLSEQGRFHLVRSLLEYGLENFPESPQVPREEERPQLFQRIITDYARGAPNENAGLTLQAIIYGFIHADRPHLSLVVDKTRTGSSRQRRFGDIDGYYGLDLEVSVEVKDKHITSQNLRHELGSFVSKVSRAKTLGLAFVNRIDEQACSSLIASQVKPVTTGDLLEIVGTWDWPKQNAAVHGMLHFLSHVEQNQFAVDRLLKFIIEIDPSHDSLVNRRVTDEPSDY